MIPATPSGDAPSRSQRLVFACLVAAVLGGYALIIHGRLLTDGRNPDSRWFWESARLFLDGRDPYTALPWKRGTALMDPLYYPLITLMPWLPLARLDFVTASALFVGIGGGLAAWVASRDGVWRFWLFASLPVMLAAQFGQWSNYLVAGTLVPSLGWLLPMKPSIGLACYLARPTWKATFLAGAAVVLPTVLLPAWPLEWLANTRYLVGHPPPIAALPPVTWLLVLLLARWRRWDARLVLAMACVPQLPAYADQLPLLLVARSRSELLLLVGAGWATFFVGRLVVGEGDVLATPMLPWVLAGTYLPAAVLVLRRSNAGVVPAWLERGAGRLPVWLRGSAVPPSSQSAGGSAPGT